MVDEKNGSLGASDKSDHATHERNSQAISSVPVGVVSAAYDKNRREIMIGDVLKVFHFTAALRRKRYYMYKQVTGERTWPSGTKRLFCSHLTMKDDDGYYLSLEGQINPDIEIVQSIDARFEDRPRKATP